MQADHVVARCTWLTGFDEQSKAAELQDFISRWSNTILHDELERCFRQWCPEPQTWRFESLQLDLGEVVLDDLAHALPLRLRAALDDAMRRLITEQRYTVAAEAGAIPGHGGRDDVPPPGGDRTAGELQILDQAGSMKAFLVFYLQHGRLPWWCGPGVNALELLDRMLAASDRAGAEVVRDVLRDVGRGESVRKRIVWQLGAARMARIVHLLEPWHGDFICDWTGNLCTAQAQRQIAPATPSAFRDGLWLTVLTHLLVDRGSVFNTIAFMRASLWQTAQRYQLDYQHLLAHLLLATEAMAPAGIVTHDFFIALQALCEHDLAPAPVRPAAAPTSVAPDQWTRFQALLRHAAQRGGRNARPLAIGDLFVVLADADPERMARQLRQQGHAASVREGLLRHFTGDQLARLVRVLAPHDHGFILAHAGHAQALADAHRWGRQTVWRVLLAYLLLAQGSYFHRRQLVHETLRQVCTVHRLDLSEVLDLLMHTAGIAYPNHHRFALLAILRDLRSDIARRREPGALAAPAPDSAAGTADPARWPAALLLQALRLRIPARGARAGSTLPAALIALTTDQLWRQLETLDGERIALWLRQQPQQERAGLLVMVTRERPLGALTRHLLARLPPELRSPRETVRQWSAVLRQGGLWQGTSAVLERHLHDVFWQVGLDAEAHPASAGELLARMVAAACLRLSLTVAQCLAVFQSQPQLLATTPWRAGYTWLQRRAGLATGSPATTFIAGANASASTQRASRRDREGASTMSETIPEPANRGEGDLSSPIRINNAGMVIMQSYFLPLLQRLQLTADKKFVDEQAQRRAVHYLQFLVRGKTRTEEQYLALNKLLCGLPLNDPLEVEFDMTEAQVELCNGLLTSVINYWPAIGKSSIDGFRGNFLVRDGLLTETADHWDLRVERRPYDMLLSRSPYTFSVIRLPWMQKALYVTWPT